ncbi:hypothetical protein FHS96_004971 [Sphingomonas zeicaulis]|uniref:hypothetical protein n=1 Tax=Sphingomonas zeicaulis TaxID=1632740 RepID=UPI003D23DD39
MASRGGNRKGGLDKLGALIDGAKVVPINGAAAARPGPEPVPERNRRSWSIEDPEYHGPNSRQRDGLPIEIPIDPLGTFDGMYYFLDELKQIRSLKSKELEKGNIEGLFGRRVDLVDRIWPRWGKPDKDGNFPITGWRPEQAARALRKSCADIGLWTPEGKVRGAGAHRADDGSLVLHCGDAVWRGDQPAGEQWGQPGVLGDMIYPAAPRTPRPWYDPVTTRVGEDLLGLIRTWHWERGTLDALLMLGWIAAASVCGALEWRPAVWVTGGRGTGKSTLQKVVELVMGTNGLLQAADVTEAWVRQTLKMRTLPIALDELEAEGDDRRAQSIIKLARLAASGAKMGRGGSDHVAHDFTMRSSFLFSSILIPPLNSADRSRMAILELQPIPENAAVPDIDAKELTAWGGMIRRRMVDEWHRLDLVLQAYRAELADVGHDPRMQDQFGTLLACADLLLYDAGDNEHIRTIAEGLDARHLAEKAEDEGEGEQAARRIATSVAQGRGGEEPETVAMWINRALAAGLPSLMGDAGADVDKVQRRLQMHGMVLVTALREVGEDGKACVKRYRGGGPPKPDNDKGLALFVAVANSHQGLDLLLRETRWSKGVWSQALARIPGAHRRQKVKIGARAEWSVLVPYAAFATNDGEDG